MIERRAIELIPRELEAEKRRSHMMRSARLLGFGILGVAVAGSVIILTFVATQKAATNKIQGQITEKETRIGELSETEEKLFLFASKNSALTGIFQTRRYFSFLFDALKNSTPAGVTVTALTAGASADTITVTGEIITYMELATFLRNLIDPAMGGTLFSEVSLTSVNLNPTEGTAVFIAEVSLTSKGLQKGWEALLVQ